MLATVPGTAGQDLQALDAPSRTSDDANFSQSADPDTDPVSALSTAEHAFIDHWGLLGRQRSKPRQIVLVQWVPCIERQAGSREL